MRKWVPRVLSVVLLVLITVGRPWLGSWVGFFTVIAAVVVMNTLLTELGMLPSKGTEK